MERRHSIRKRPTRSTRLGVRRWLSMPLLPVVITTLLVSGTLAGVLLDTAGASGSSCGFYESVNVAFCDPLSTSDPTAGTRSGDLNGVLWGVSRELGYNNLGQGQYDAAVNSLLMAGSCPTESVTVETDIRICKGQMNDVVNYNPNVTTADLDAVGDGGTVTSLAMYPKQPFDFAGRTGTIVFDVGDDSGGAHAAWPELWVTSTPAPDPFVH